MVRVATGHRNFIASGPNAEAALPEVIRGVFDGVFDGISDSISDGVSDAVSDDSETGVTKREKWRTADDHFESLRICLDYNVFESSSSLE